MLYFSDFVQGKGEPPPDIDDITCRRLVQRSVAAIFAHLGFDSKNFLLCKVIQNTMVPSMRDHPFYHLKEVFQDW